ncbi:Spo11/DNA topoisomerase VI subunit A [Microdochium bolleyi]|uniref:DNA topoisomerase (ATP-hydrolyzing) n=1 Tax=Microdochium bolleyi TaxID=196109 RepID=A0A136J8J3_9PEZI|nr:Spo11/DNA topoisomerase VI subunit A [Microdochium bolleyi]
MSLHHGAELGVVVAKTEDILESLVDALAIGAAMKIPLRSRRTGHQILVRFPGSNEKEVKKFTALLLILHVCHEALTKDYIVTKRNIYYQDPGLFGSQDYVDRLVDDIAFTFGVSRDALNIVAAAKGLVAGNLTVTFKDGLMLYCDGYEKDQDSLLTGAQATFTSLASARFHTTASAGGGIIVTGKGYPDLATRQFLHYLHDSFPAVPMLAMVDYDPDGLAILTTYTSGSYSLRHEEDVTIPSLIWLGPSSQDITRIATATSAESDALQLQRPTRADRRKATSLLNRLADGISDDVKLVNVVRELQLMLFLNVKSEIQMLDEEGQLANWLDRRLCDLLGSG